MLEGPAAGPGGRLDQSSGPARAAGTGPCGPQATLQPPPAVVQPRPRPPPSGGAFLPGFRPRWPAPLSRTGRLHLPPPAPSPAQAQPSGLLSTRTPRTLEARVPLGTPSRLLLLLLLLPPHLPHLHPGESPSPAQQAPALGAIHLLPLPGALVLATLLHGGTCPTATLASPLGGLQN